MNREEFLTDRRKSIGGADIGAILGLSQFKTPVGVWMDKTGRSPINTESTLPQEFGIFAEPFVATQYVKNTSRQVVNYNKKLIHPEFDYFTGNVDRLVIPLGAKIAAHMGEIRTDRGMEAKAVSAYAGGEWGDDDSDDVPAFYLCQSQWYIGLNPIFRYWDLAALIGNHRFEVYEFQRDQEIIDTLQAKAHEFWNNNVLKDVAPPPISEEDVALLFPKSSEGKKIAANKDIIASLDEVKKERDAIKSAEVRYEAARVIVKNYMANAEMLMAEDIGAKPLVTWKNNKDSTYVEYEKAYDELLRKCEIAGLLPKPELDGLHQELLAKYKKTKVGARVFLIK